MRLTHSFSTVSIGGFSTHDASIGYFNSSAINFITVIFLWISACNFALHFRAFSTLGRENILKIYTKDPEFRFFMSIQILLIVACTLVMISHQYFDSSWQDFEQVVFQAVSISTTTGYTTSNFAEWPSFVPMLLIIASFIGGCAGSVGGGLRVARILVLYLQGARELKRFVHPNLVYPIKWGQNVLDERVIGSIWAFFSAYLLVFTICLLSVIACGVAPFDAFNAVLASINNLGPGLGSVSSNMTAMPDSAKWVLTIAMVCGRLEIFTSIGALHTGILEGIMKTLILYSSRDGQTKKIAEFMAQYLEGEVVVSPLMEELDLQFFDRVIIGASIRYGHFNKQLYHFVERHHELLNAKSAVFFGVNLTARKEGKDTPEGNVYVRKFLQRIKWTPAKVGVFAGRIVISTL